jgi:hypothetical protein
MNIDLVGFKKAVASNEATKALIEKKTAQFSEYDHQISAKTEAISHVEQRIIQLHKEKTIIEQNAITAIDKINIEINSLVKKSQALTRENEVLITKQNEVLMEHYKIRKAQKQSIMTLMQIVDGGRDIDLTITTLEMISNFFVDARDKHKAMIASTNSICLDECDKTTFIKLFTGPSTAAPIEITKPVATPNIVVQTPQAHVLLPRTPLSVPTTPGGFGGGGGLTPQTLLSPNPFIPPMVPQLPSSVYQQQTQTQNQVQSQFSHYNNQYGHHIQHMNTTTTVNTVQPMYSIQPAFVHPASPSPVPSPMRSSLSISGMNVTNTTSTVGPTSSQLLGASIVSNAPPTPTYIPNYQTVNVSSPQSQQQDISYIPSTPIAQDVSTSIVAYPFIQDPQVSCQHNLIIAQLYPNSYSVGSQTFAQPTTIKGLPSTCLIQRADNNNTIPNFTPEDYTNWNYFQTSSCYPVVYTWQEYCLLVGKLFNPAVAPGFFMLPTVLKIPKEMMSYTLSQVAPNNIYNALQAWNFSINGSILVIVDNLTDEITEVAEVNQIAYRFKINDTVAVNTFKTNRPKLLVPCLNYDKILEEYTKYIFPLRTTVIATIAQEIIENKKSNPNNPLIPLVVVASRPNIMAMIAKYIKQTIIMKAISTSTTADASTIQNKSKRGKKAKFQGIIELSKIDSQYVISNLPRLNDLVTLVGNISDALVADPSYFISFASMDKSAPLTIPPYHFLDTPTRIHYKKRACPSLANYNHESDCFKPKPFTLPSTGKCTLCDCTLEMDYYGSLLVPSKGAKSNGSSIQLNKAKKYLISGYTHCKCPVLNYCIPCLVLMWINSVHPQANQLLHSMASCGMCGYSWSLNSIFPVKRE